ncbi:catalase [Tsukamurella soli]|uniref:Catalase n=1 Tax=Tsukamurella soli TaxID=644556 RepID=A0ABP8J5M8_9ACTN
MTSDQPDSGGDTQRGEGGEFHQTSQETLTTSQGAPVVDNQNSLRVGAPGPTLLEDQAFRDKIFRFDHERIPERVVHARGYGAHGVFETTAPLPEVTVADLFREAGEKTPVFVRFSTVAGRAGSPDLARDVRGFAVKFYTREGNWDLVGNNIPVFFIQDAIKFPDLIHAVKEEPDRGFPQAQSAHDNFWDFISFMPESTHMTLWQMSDRAIPRSFRFMEGFGIHTFRFLDEHGASTYVKFHWRPVLGCQSVLWNEAVKINGADPDFHRRDMWDSITRGDFPQWDLAVQLFDEETAQGLEFDPLDPTKLIPEEDIPLRIVGRMTLDRVIENEFAETEQVAFCTQNIVPGIDFTDDPLLQGRNFSYLDTQLSRLGSPNFTQIPINAPTCPVASFARDGHMQTTVPTGPVNYEPNGRSGAEAGPRARPQLASVTSFETEVSGVKARLRPESFADHYSQARVFWISQNDIERDHIVDAYVFELSKVVDPHIRIRVVANLRNVDEKLAVRVAAGIGIPVPEPSEPFAPVRDDLPPSPALSILRNPPGTFAGRKLGVLVTNGTDAELLDALRSGVAEAGATIEVIAPKVGGVTLSDGQSTSADAQLAGAPAVLYDAVAVIPSQGEIDELAKDPAAKDFVNDAFHHFKFIGVGEYADRLFEKVGLRGRLDAGCLRITTAATTGEFLDSCADLRFWDRNVFE